MTLEEAIKHAEEKAKCGGGCGEDHAQLAMWLKELQKLRAVETEKRNGKSAQNVSKEDLISRKAAIDAVVKMFEAWYGGSVLRDREIRARFDALPSAQPEQAKMIKEIRKCINSGNRGSADYFIVDQIEEIINKYE